MLRRAAPSSAPSWATRKPGSWIAKPSAVTRHNNTWSDGAGDDIKIGYISPSFSGFTVAASYAPDVNETHQGSAASAADSQWDAGIAYKGKMGDVSLGADIFYTKTNGGESAGTQPAGLDAIGGGLKIGFGAFTVSGGYKAVDQAKNATFSSQDGDVWSVGGEYKSGPMKVALSWMHSETEGEVDTTADDKVDTVFLQGSYDLGGGVSLAGTIVKADYDDETTNKSNNNEAWAAVGAVQLYF